jgi:sugar lactone lactonase YvrE
LNTPEGLALDGQGNLYIADLTNNRVREVSPSGVITTFAGIGSAGAFGFSGDGGPATAAQLARPRAVAVDAAGNVYIADNDNQRVRKVSPGGTISTFAGGGVAQGLGDGGPATSARLSANGVAVDAGGNVYIADFGNNRVREVTPDGTINTFAGTGTPGSSGDGGPATSANLNSPGGVAIDQQGDLLIYSDCRLSKISSGIITKVAGIDACLDTGDGGPAISAGIAGTTGGIPLPVALDSQGHVYLADYSNNIVHRIGPAPAQTPAPTPRPTTPPPVSTTPKPKPISAGSAFSLPSAKSCVRRGHRLTIRIRKLPGITFTGAIVKVRGKRVKTVKRSRITKPIVLTGLPTGRFAVTITASTSDGRTVTGKRIYHACASKHD